jgi:hypothetical protein
MPPVDMTVPDLRAYAEPAFPAVSPGLLEPGGPGGPVDPADLEAPPEQRAAVRRHRRRPHALAVAGVVLTIGAGATMIAIGWHGSGPPQPPRPTSLNAPVPVVNARPMSRALPVRITIPRIHVDAPVEPLGQNPDGTVEVPTLTRPNLAGWYKYGPTPGQRGAAVVLGHVDAHRHHLRRQVRQKDDALSEQHHRLRASRALRHSRHVACYIPRHGVLARGR